MIIPVEQIELYQVEIPFLSPFKYSGGELRSHSCLIIAVKSQGLTGWGECPTFIHPYYTSETMVTAFHILRDFLIPAVIGKQINSPPEITTLMSQVRGHQMAKSALESAVWDLFAQVYHLSLAQLLGGVRDRVKVGVSVSLAKNLSQLSDRIQEYVEQGYQRIKLKISPDWALKPLQTVREQYPQLMLMADANSVFTLADLPLFQQMDQLDLIMIEQPLAYDDLLDHASLQSQIKTPICLDESINSINDTRLAITLKSAQVINLKVSRVGGISNTLKIHDLCQQAGIKLWCGGMLESGIGRSTNLHIASLANFTLPADISATNRYFAEDIIETPILLNPEDSTISVPTELGIGVKVNHQLLDKYSQGKLIVGGR
jgi:O-succinylbenzoate synthase